MKQPVFLMLLASLLFACNDPGNSLATENNHLEKENDSLKNVIANEGKDTATVSLPDSSNVPVENLERAGVHPISLQWIGWDKKGEATVTPLGDGWYSIKGTQSNADKDELRIDGKIRRLSKKELEFEGTIETKVKYNNGGEVCVKSGRQHFAAKGNRTYYRLQKMENCEGGRLVDYVDIYPGSSSL